MQRSMRNERSLHSCEWSCWCTCMRMFARARVCVFEQDAGTLHVMPICWTVAENLPPVPARQCASRAAGAAQGRSKWRSRSGGDGYRTEQHHTGTRRARCAQARDQTHQTPPREWGKQWGAVAHTVHGQRLRNGAAASHSRRGWVMMTQCWPQGNAWVHEASLAHAPVASIAQVAETIAALEEADEDDDGSDEDAGRDGELADWRAKASNA